jgi:hypothetical protein
MVVLYKITGCRDFRGSEGVGRLSYLALPGQVVFVVSAAVQRDQEVGAGVSVSEGESGIGHFLAGSSCGVTTWSAWCSAQCN